MRIWKVLGGAAVALALAACQPTDRTATEGNWVPRAEFDAYKQRIKANGDAVDRWIVAANPWFVLLNSHGSTWCPNCGLPPLPPPPPPDEGWQ